MAAFSTKIISNGSATTTGAQWQGGRGALVIMGTLATTTKLQIKGQDGTTWIDVATPTTAGVTALDLPQGTYRLSLSGGSPAGIYADLVSIPYP